jgi:hypothetical protein
MVPVWEQHHTSPLQCRAAKVALLWWRFTCSTLILWMFFVILQGPKLNSSWSPEGLAFQLDQSFIRGGINRKGQCLLLSSIFQLMITQSDLSSPRFWARRCVKTLFTSETSGNANNHPGFLWEVFGVNHYQLHSPSSLTAHKSQAWEKFIYFFPLLLLLLLLLLLSH